MDLRDGHRGERNLAAGPQGRRPADEIQLAIAASGAWGDALRGAMADVLREDRQRGAAAEKLVGRGLDVRAQAAECPRMR